MSTHRYDKQILEKQNHRFWKKAQK
jgi:hypothetical protein